MGINPGVAFGQWIQANVVGLFAALLAVFGLIVLLKRKVIAGITLLLVGGLGAILVFNGSDFAQKIADLIMSFF